MKHLLMLLVLSLAPVLSAQDWPREVVSSEGTITMYQPQIESYSGDALKARAAVSIIPEGKTDPVFGAIWIDCRVLTDRPTRTVMLKEMEVRRTRFPSGTDVDTAKIADALEEMIPRFDLTFSLDLLLESVETAQKEKVSARELETTPPDIIVLSHPAVLVRIDGDPIFNNIDGTSLKRVINTPYFLVQENAGKNFYLHGGDIWFQATNIKGPWKQTDTPPHSVVDLYEQTKSDDESDADSTTNDLVSKTGKVPEIVISTEPAELIATDGKIQFTPIEGTDLLYASNTPSRVFLEINTQEYFILISGRWFTAATLTGPWTFIASEKLPADFKNIPPGSERDDILASVAGTIPAKEAVFDAQIPQMAEVDRSQTTTQVDYDGDPQFEPIGTTGMEYAVNTATAIIRVNGRYYDCDQGVWFEGGSPFGPWDVCINVPEIIYTIPPSCPVYGVRYVRVYTYTPEMAYVGYTAGYTGCYVYGRTVVYGTGYNYHPWYKHSYYARPWTWGLDVHYDPWSGWSVGAGWEKPHGWFVHQPNIVHAGWWGPANNHPEYHPITKPVYRTGYNPVYHPTAASTLARTATEGRLTSNIPRSATLYDQRGSGIRRPIANVPVQPIRIETQRSQPTPTETRPVNRSEPSSIQEPESRQPGRIEMQRPQPTPPVVTQPVTIPIRQPEPQPITTPAQRPESRQSGSTMIQRPQPSAPTVSQPIITPVRQPEPTPVSPSATRIETHTSPRENNVYAAPDGSIMRSTPQGWQQRDQNTWKQAPEAPAKQATVRDSEVRQRAAERTSTFKPSPPPQPAPRSNNIKDDKRR